MAFNALLLVFNQRDVGKKESLNGFTMNERINVISTPITTSIFDLFNVGPGPASSHTIGPMKATFDFWQRLAQLPESVRTRANDINTYFYC